MTPYLITIPHSYPLPPAGHKQEALAETGTEVQPGALNPSISRSTHPGFSIHPAIWPPAIPPAVLQPGLTEQVSGRGQGHPGADLHRWIQPEPAAVVQLDHHCSGPRHSPPHGGLQADEVWASASQHLSRSRNCKVTSLGLTPSFLHPMSFHTPISPLPSPAHFPGTLVP